MELICGKTIHKSKVKSNDLSPDFNETFEFSVGRAEQILTVNVWDYDFVKSDKLLGTFEIPLFKLNAGEINNQW